MTCCKRLIARLDIKGKRLIKGIRFEGLRVIGDACDSAEQYAINGIDEIFYTDAVASLYGRNGLCEVLRDTSKKVFVPITVGGAIRSVDDGRKLLGAGADKLAINSAAIRNPDLIDQLSKKFGRQCVVISIQVFYRGNSSWNVMIESGREKTNKKLNDWILECQDRGAGEIFITSVDRDGTGKGPDLELIESVKKNIKIPLVLGGGFSSSKDVVETFRKHNYLSGVSIGWGLHYNKLDINLTKNKMKSIDLPVRDVPKKFIINSIKENLKISVIDYGMGNTQSLINAFDFLEVDCNLTTNFKIIEESNICVLPGVGAFPEGMKQLNKFNLIEKIKDYSRNGGNLIGICLGMQLLLSVGTEYEECDGLNIIQGVIKKLPDYSKESKETIVPHVGWNKIKYFESSNYKSIKDFNNIDQYFVHSYALMYSEDIKNNVLYTTDFEGHNFVSMIRKYNTLGMQFHPERSGRNGLNLIKDSIQSLIKSYC